MSLITKKRLLLAAVALAAINVTAMALEPTGDDSHSPAAISAQLMASADPVAGEVEAPGEHAGEGEAEGEHAEGESEEAKPLTPEQMQEAGIVVEAVVMKPLPKLFRAPGEVRLNDYTSSIISPRISGTVVQRHVVLGAAVKKGDPLLRLFSVQMAEAQSAFILAAQEFARVKQIGRDVISERRYDEARIKLQEARTRLETYGLTTGQIDSLASKGTAGSSAGEFDLIAIQDGIIVAEDFRVGEVVEPGKTVMEIADGKSIWINARVSAEDAAQIQGKTARFFVGEEGFDATVAQIDPKLDEATRTIGVRLEATDEKGRLKPGTFVDVHLYGAAEPVLAVPTEAVLRSPDGDWAVQVEQSAGIFKATEVEVLYAVENQTAITGIPEGTRIAVKGAFFVAAEAAKGGFDPHGH
jgi:RND family efflux transporter MFP subunit